MKKLENFEELKATMINPLDNPDFYALLLGDDRYREMASHRGAFSMCHNYDLGSTIYKNYHDLLSIAIQQYLQNSDYQELIDILNRNGEKTPQEYEELRKYFSEYFKKENMNLGEIKKLRQQISKNLVKIHPQLPKDNMFNIDVEDVLYKISLEKQSEMDSER